MQSFCWSLKKWDKNSNTKPLGAFLFFLAWLCLAGFALLFWCFASGESLAYRFWLALPGCWVCCFCGFAARDCLALLGLLAWLGAGFAWVLGFALLFVCLLFSVGGWPLECIGNHVAKPLNGLLRHFSGCMLPRVHVYMMCDCRRFYAIQHKNNSLKTQ